MNTNYEYKDKDLGWRQPVWRQMAKRVRGRPEDAVVLYLAGPKNLDLPVALESGFRRENLIAVEDDRDIAQTLRSSGQLVVGGSLTEVVKGWSDSTPIRGIVADFCGDLCVSDLEFSASFLVPDALRACVFAFNFKRGRDSTLNEFREGVGPRVAHRVGGNAKHRGALFLAGAMEYAIKTALIAAPNWSFRKRGKFLRDATRHLIKTAYPVYTEYLNERGNGYFDGVIFRNPLSRPPTTPGGKNRELFPDADTTIRRSVSAVLAHRTRRLTAA